MVRADPPSTLARLIAVAGGLVFVASLLYFVASYAWRFDAAASGDWPPAAAIVVDLALFSVFALHHSVFARASVKRGIEHVIPPALERSAYVWIASVLFAIVCAVWIPVPGRLWLVTGPLRWLLVGIQVAAAITAVLAARRLSVLELAGVRQLWPQPADHAAAVLLDRGLYGIVRHPIYLAWLFMVWPAPDMNGTRLVFAAVSSTYLAIAIPFEERALARTFGDAYTRYRRRVRWRMLPGVY
jgi:protein-S-isoprenylcysteine O-methyltransferase Ste14